MKIEYKILLTGIVAIAALDAAASIASREANFNYAFLGLVSYFLYGVFSFVTTVKKDLITGVAVATAIGLFDATIGWKISILLHANMGNLNNPSPEVWIGSAMFVVLAAAIIGFIAARLAKFIYRNK